jgi:hypothetical protein
MLAGFGAPSITCLESIEIFSRRNGWGHRIPLEAEKGLIMINCISKRTLRDLKEIIAFVGKWGFGKVVGGRGGGKGDIAPPGGRCWSSEHLIHVSKIKNKKMSDSLPGTLQWQDAKNQSDSQRILRNDLC